MTKTPEEKRAYHAAWMREYTRKNKDKINARRKELHQQNPERNRELQRKWRAENPERVKHYDRIRKPRKKRYSYPEKSAAWRRNNPEKVREYKLRDYYKDVEKSRAAQRRRYAATKKRKRELARLHYHKNRAKILARYKEQRAADPERTRRWQEASRQRHRGRYLFYSIRKKCRVDGLEFDLTPEWIQAKLDAGVCELSGRPFDMVAKRGPNSPSVDRKIPHGGYTQENCRVILWFLNRAMSNLGEDFALDAFSAVLERRNGADVERPHHRRTT